GGQCWWPPLHTGRGALDSEARVGLRRPAAIGWGVATPLPVTGRTAGAAQIAARRGRPGRTGCETAAGQKHPHKVGAAGVETYLTTWSWSGTSPGLMSMDWPSNYRLRTWATAKARIGCIRCTLDSPASSARILIDSRLS